MVVEPQGARLRAEYAGRAHPAQGGGMWGFGDQFVPVRAQRADQLGRWHAAVIRERDANPLGGQLRGHVGHAAARCASDHGDDRPGRVHPLERLHVQDLGRQRRNLVGRHHPGAETQQERELPREAHRAHPPAGDRTHTRGDAQDDLSRGRMLLAGPVPEADCAGVVHQENGVRDVREGASSVGPLFGPQARILLRGI